MAEWDAEWIVDPDALHRAAGSPRAWRHLASGWDCDAWLADESVIWRVPRRAVGAAALERELVLLPVLAPRLPAPVPVPERVEADGLPVLARHALVPGEELALRGAAGPALGAALGRFLAALHAPELLAAARGLVPVDPLGRADATKRVAVTRRRLEDVAAMLDIAPLHAIVDAAVALAPPIEVLGHGDLHVRHVLVDDRGGLAGVIDWGDACVTARAVDLAIATALPSDAREAFVREYGPVGEDTWRFARLVAVMLGASLLAADPAGAGGRGARGWLDAVVAHAHEG